MRDLVQQAGDTINSEWQRYYGSLADGGPIYTETDLSQIIPEPWNALSSLLIAAPAVYWAFRLRGHYKDYLFLTFCLPLLFLGGMGSTFFHAFRASYLLLLMDVLPTAILMFSVILYLWYKVLPQKWLLGLVIVLLVGLQVAVRTLYEAHTSINASYFITGTMLFLPLLLIVYKTKGKHFLQIGGALFFFVAALYFREIDAHDDIFLPMGTHWLWHICTGIGGFMLADYLYYLYPLRLVKQKAFSS